MNRLFFKGSVCLIFILLGLMSSCKKTSQVESESDLAVVFAKQRVRENKRAQAAKMPDWLKENRQILHSRMIEMAQKSYEETGVWFFARGAGRGTDEQETMAVWGDLLFFGGLETLPGYSENNREKAVKFWKSWQNLETGKLYNPLYQDPQNPEVKRSMAGNRNDYSAEEINTKYIPSILKILGDTLSLPVNVTSRADAGVDTFDDLWGWMPQWMTSKAGAYPYQAAVEVDNGNFEKIPQVEAGMAALVRAYNRETGMWRPEPLDSFPWEEYQPSSGFKIIARICGYAGMENFPEELVHVAVDNMLAHKNELYTDETTARNYGETMAHYLMLTDYRHDELLDAMELCLQGFKDSIKWKKTASSVYCVFGSGIIGLFLNWEDLPDDLAFNQWFRFEQGCTMKWRFVVGPYGNWVNVIPKNAEEIFGNENYDVGKYGLKARNKVHWSKKRSSVIEQQDVTLKVTNDDVTGEGTFTFSLTAEQLSALQQPYFEATWSGEFQVSLNGEPVKIVKYNLPDLKAGWYIPEPAVKTLRVGENTVTIELLGPGKDQKPDAPLSKTAPFIRIGLIDWS
ncbi:hypothetical protein [Mangrovibacterium diazotrophicum]|uniref:Uncharacterized protein n=1 Tax=Mangrovibacterium diazotrophicum TaxID=1261403 RepID=A0A419VW51_9BACT|nr:hypothetical protein [Mangrovibacterium diazotrophicum]RKD86373.1 hypothetical protein BC643_4064 [Mangrovibacterium diazotrophicum]